MLKSKNLAGTIETGSGRMKQERRECVYVQTVSNKKKELTGTRNLENGKVAVSFSRRMYQRTNDTENWCKPDTGSQYVFVHRNVLQRCNSWWQFNIDIVVMEEMTDGP